MPAPIVLLAAVLTSTASADGLAPGETPRLSTGAYVIDARARAERFVEEAKHAVDRRALEASFLGLDREVQREVLDAWKRLMPPTANSLRSRERLVELYERGQIRSHRPPPLPVVEAHSREPPLEITLAFAEYFTGLLGLITWELFAGVVLPAPTSDNAAALLVVDGIAASFVVGGIVYAIARSSDYYEVKWWPPVIAAGGTYAIGALIGLAQGHRARELAKVNAIVAVTIVAIPLAATALVNATKVRHQPELALEHRALEPIFELPRPDETNTMLFNVFSTTW